MNTARPLLEVQDLVKNYGGLTVTDHLSLALPTGELHAVIGPNGAGKSTLIHQLGGGVAPTSGRIRFDGEDITALPPWRRAQRGLGRSYQITSVFPEFSALDNVLLAVQAHEGGNFRFWRRADQHAASVARACDALEQAGLANARHKPVTEMAHGEKRQLEMAMALATRPKLLLLDEPMAGMSHVESEQVVSLLAGLKGRYTILLVEHDMDAVFALADRITVLVYGRAVAVGTPQVIRNNPLVAEAYLGTEELAQ